MAHLLSSIDTSSDRDMIRVLKLLSSILTTIAERNDVLSDRHRNSSPPPSIFQGLARPTISVESYLQRIFKYANCSPACFVVAYIYLDRFVQRQPSIWINPFNVHRLLISSVLVSAKFMDDVFYDNAYYAKLGGISTAEMNLLEVDFLFGIGFRLYVSVDNFQYYCSYLRGQMILKFPPLTVVSPVSPSPSASASDQLRLANNAATAENLQSSTHHQQHQQLAV